MAVFTYPDCTQCCPGTASGCCSGYGIDDPLFLRIVTQTGCDCMFGQTFTISNVGASGGCYTGDNTALGCGQTVGIMAICCDFSSGCVGAQLRWSFSSADDSFCLSSGTAVPLSGYCTCFPLDNTYRIEIPTNCCFGSGSVATIDLNLTT